MNQEFNWGTDGSNDDRDPYWVPHKPPGIEECTYCGKYSTPKDKEPYCKYCGTPKRKPEDDE